MATIVLALYTPAPNNVNAVIPIEMRMLGPIGRKKNGMGGISDPMMAEKPTMNALRIAWPASIGVSFNSLFIITSTRRARLL